MSRNGTELTTETVRKQLAAMGAPVLEVGLYRPDAANAGSPEMLPRTWDADTLLRSIPWMRFQNLNGRNVYVRPRGEHNLTLLDDLSAGAITRMKSCGFAPAAIVETSPGNFQAWLKHREPLPKDLSTAVARHLAAEFGADRGAADWRHFGRLAGFTNRKAKYDQGNGRFPFVRLIAATGEHFPEGGRVVDEIRKQLVRDLERRQSFPRYTGPCGGEHVRSIDAFRSNPIYGGDNTRVDLAYAVYALSRGVPDESVAAAIRSRDLSHKGKQKRQDEYVVRTMNKALLTIEKSRGLSR